MINVARKSWTWQCRSQASNYASIHVGTRAREKVCSVPPLFIPLLQVVLLAYCLFDSGWVWPRAQTCEPTLKHLHRTRKFSRHARPASAPVAIFSTAPATSSDKQAGKVKPPQWSTLMDRQISRRMFIGIHHFVFTCTPTLYSQIYIYIYMGKMPKIFKEKLELQSQVCEPGGRKRPALQSSRLSSCLIACNKCNCSR